MLTVANNWICIVLACLLVIAPLGRAMAEVHHTAASHPKQSMAGTMHHAGHSDQSTMKTQGCEKCTGAHACTGTDCPCSQCTSCVTSLLPALLDIHFATLSQRIPAGTQGLLSYLPSPLFRPPRR